MYGLPKDFNGSFFLGRVLEMICFNKHQIYFHLDQNIMITLESGFIHNVDDEVILANSLPVYESRLLELIGYSIIEAVQSADGTLSLLFSNRHKLSLLDSSKNYESYQIKRDKNILII